MHAEMHVLLKVLRTKNIYCLKNKKDNYLLKNATFYVARPMHNNSSDYGRAAPCNNCVFYLSLFGVERIKYTDVITNYDGTKINVLCELKRN